MFDTTSPSGTDRATGVKSYDSEISSQYEENLKIPIRIFLPPSNEKCQVFVFFHGGGFCIGGARDSQYHELCVRIASNNYVVVSADYRLAPEHKFPAAIFDSYEALRWVSSEPDDLKKYVDFSKGMIIGGDSAGGNIACVLASLARDKLGPDLKPVENDFEQKQLS